MSRNSNSWSDGESDGGFVASLDDSLDEILDEARSPPTVTTASLRPPGPTPLPDVPPQSYGYQPATLPATLPSPAYDAPRRLQTPGLPPPSYTSPAHGSPVRLQTPAAFSRHDTPEPDLPAGRTTPVLPRPQGAAPDTGARQLRTISLGAISLLIGLSFLGGIGATLIVEQLLGSQKDPTATAVTTTAPAFIQVAPPAPRAPVITALPTPAPAVTSPLAAIPSVPGDTRAMPLETAPARAKGSLKRPPARHVAAVQRKAAIKAAAPRAKGHKAKAHKATGASGGDQPDAEWNDPFAQ